MSIFWVALHGHNLYFQDYCQYAVGFASYYDLNMTGFNMYISDSRGKNLDAEDLKEKWEWRFHYSIAGGC